MDMNEKKFNENYDSEGMTGELKGTDENVSNEPVSDDMGTYQYGYDNPYYEGRVLPQYMNQSQYTGQNQYSEQNPYNGMNKETGQKQNTEQNNAPVQKKNGKKNKNKKRSGAGKFARLVASALVFGLVAGAAFQGFNYGVDRIQGTKTEKTAQEKSENVETQQLANTDDTTNSTLVYDVSDIAEKVMPSIVSITSTYTTTYQYWFQEYEQQSTGAGSGIILDKDNENLMIVTNYHVVEDAEEINVGFVDGEVVKATLRGYDEDADIAVLFVSFDDMKDSTVDAISIAAVGDSDSLQVGEPAIAIGNALGYGQSVTVGYISALDRTISDSEGEFIQTDAAINPGNSGGALINISGEVIGINSVKYVDSSVEGMGYAIPISDAYPIIESIIKGTNSGYQGLGITGVEISKEYSQIYGFPEGIYVKEVEENSPADEAGINAGDIIVEFDGEEVYTIEELQNLIKEKAAGDSAKIVLYRLDSHGRYQQVEIDVVFD